MIAMSVNVKDALDQLIDMYAGTIYMVSNMIKLPNSLFKMALNFLENSLILQGIVWIYSHWNYFKFLYPFFSSLSWFDERVNNFNAGGVLI